jgi:hypothetical protein
MSKPFGRQAEKRIEGRFVIHDKAPLGFFTSSRISRHAR